MALIADIVESVIGALRGVGSGFRWTGDRVAADMGKIVEVWGDFFVPWRDEGLDFGLVGNFITADQLGEFSLLALTDPQEFIKQLFDKWDRLLRGAMGALNVEIAGIIPPGTGGPEVRIAANLEAGRNESQRRVSATLAAINFIILSGNAVSLAAEIASVGTVRSIAEAIQAWVWANGLGSFSPLAFQPQINASLSPYLNRFYNSRAQAQIPPVTDIIRFQLREVFLEGRREELVGEEQRPVFDALMREWGFDKFHADSYWGAHWQLPSVSQLNEMLFRGVFDVAEWERFIRFNDLEPSSIPRLRDIIFNPYTRVDARRMARMGILSDDELLQAYADLGFFAPTMADDTGRFRATFVADPDFTIHKAQALVIFTKVFNAVPELRQRFAKGHISGGEVLAGLIDTGIPSLRAQRLFETIVRDEGPARIAPEKELTRAMVARAWKLRLISFPQATFLLTRMGWSEPESELILLTQSDNTLPDDFIPTVLGIRLGALSTTPPVEEEPP